MEIENKKKSSIYNNEKLKEEFAIHIKEIKTLYQCNTLKSFNKPKNMKRIKDEGNEYENKLLNSKKQIYKYNNSKNYKKPLSIRYSMDHNNKKPFYDNNTSQKKNNYNDSDKVNFNNDNSMKNIKKIDNKKYISSFKKEKNFLNNNYLTKSSAFINIRNIEVNNKNEQDSFVNSINNILIENKNKIKQNQGKINNLINSKKSEEINNIRNNVDNSDNNEITNDNKNRTRQLFRYTKKLPQKNNEIPSQRSKNENIKNLKQSQMNHNSDNNNNLITNGLNQIYKKSFTVHEEKYCNFILNKDNKNNIYPNRLFDNNPNDNNIKIKTQIKESNRNAMEKNDIIYVNKIKTNLNNDINNRCNNENERKRNKINSPKCIYIPKKAQSFRGISQENGHNIRRKYMSPVNLKKIYVGETSNKNSNNNTKNIQLNENDKYFYNYSEKRNKNNKNEDNNYNYIKNKGRWTYSRKTSVKKQNYCWQNNNSYDSKIKNDRNDNSIIINKDNEKDNFNINDIFDNEINDISSIKLNSSYDSYIMDFESNFKYKTPNIPKADNYYNNYNNKTEKRNNIVYIHKYNNNGGNIHIFNNEKEYNIKKEKVSDKNMNQNKIENDNFRNNYKNENNQIESDEKQINKQNIRYIKDYKKISDKFIGAIEANKIKNPICFSTTTFSSLKKGNNGIKSNINRNNINYKSQKNYFNNRNKIEEKNRNKNSKFNRILKNEIISFGLEDLVVLEEKLKDVLTSLEEDKPIYNNCFDFLNYIKNNCDILHKLNLLIKRQEDFIIVNNAINYIVFSIILLFDYSYKKEFLNQFILLMKEIMNFNYKNFIFVYEYLLDNTLLSEIKNIWEFKIYQIISSATNEKDNNNSFENIMNLNDNDNKKGNILFKIKDNTSFIFQTIKIILKNYTNKNSTTLFYFFKEIHKKSSFKDIFSFFRNKILYSNGLFGYMSPQLVLKQNSSFRTVNPPFLKNISKKKYTLVLGLEETLINFKFSSTKAYNNNISGILRFRPAINYFLSEIKKYFEVIVFSLYPQKIGDYLIDTIEKNEKYFDYRFFIQHSIVYDNEFVKDLKRIGRPLDKIIIVDNLPQNYRLNKKNGINIKSYWEEDYNDVALSQLSRILINIAQEGGDVRDGIERYKDEILGKITSKFNL